MKDLTTLSNNDLIFEHRAAAADWQAIHAVLFARNENDEYVYPTGEPTLQDALNKAMDRCDRAEAELERRMNGA